MAIWETSADEILRCISRDEFRFLTGEKPVVYLAVLIELYRARRQHLQLEVPFEDLFQAVARHYQLYDFSQQFDAGLLRQDLNALEAHGNVKQRIEPRRVRRIQDRALDRVLVRLTDSTSQILSQLESRLEHLVQARASSARFSLIDVDDALSDALKLLHVSRKSLDHETACRGGRSIARARKGVEEAGEELLRLDLRLSEFALDVPEHTRLLELIHQLEAYFDRYLNEVEQRRRGSFEKLGRLLSGEATDLLKIIDAAMAREMEEDPTRQGAAPRATSDTLAIVNEFLEPGGILDEQRHVVHERLADVAGHLKRHLAEVVRRSQLLDRLRHLSSSLMAAEAEVFHDGRADALMVELWQAGHLVLDDTPGTPKAQVTPPRPHWSGSSVRRQPAGALFTPRVDKRQRDARALMLEKMKRLNEFIDRAVLRGRESAVVSQALLEGPRDARLLIEAVRVGGQHRSRVRRRYIKYQVSTASPTVSVDIETLDRAGWLHLPQLVFRRGTLE